MLAIDPTLYLKWVGSSALPYPMSRPANSSGLTRYGCFVVLWVLVLSFQASLLSSPFFRSFIPPPYQYGYHISALNQLQAVLTCQHTVPNSIYGLPTCIPMSDATFSLVTSLFTVGGLLGSLSANLVMDRYGRKGASRFSAVFNTAGAAISGLAPSVAPMALGRFAFYPISARRVSTALLPRFLVGVAAGIGICVGPIYLSEIAPPEIKGSLGNQSRSLTCHLKCLIHPPRGSDAARHRRWNHGHAGNGFWSSHSHPVASRLLHLFRLISSAVPPRAGYCRVASLSQSEWPYC